MNIAKMYAVANGIVLIIEEARRDGKVPCCPGCGTEFKGNDPIEQFISGMEHCGFDLAQMSDDEVAEIEATEAVVVVDDPVQPPVKDAGYARKLHNLFTDLFGPSKPQNARWN